MSLYEVESMMRSLNKKPQTGPQTEAEARNFFNEYMQNAQAAWAEMGVEVKVREWQ